jgi:hypothetical protein
MFIKLLNFIIRLLQISSKMFAILLAQLCVCLTMMHLGFHVLTGILKNKLLVLLTYYPLLHPVLE